MFSRAIMDDHLLRAFAYKKPPAPVVWLSRASLRLRARIVRFMPARRKPQHAIDLKRITSYPGGFIVERLGTFPATMREVSDESSVAEV